MSELEIILSVLTLIFATGIIVQSVLFRNAVPVDKINELLTNLKAVSERTASPLDDTAVKILGTLWQSYVDSRTPKTPPAE